MYELLKGLLDGIRPTPLLTVSEWADRHRYLAPTSSAEPGPWRTERTPFLREIMDKLSANDPVQEVIVMKGAQLGFTECGNNWLGYIIDIAPGPVMMVMPTGDTVKRNSKIRIDPMIEASPSLSKKIAEKRSRDSGNTIFSKDFPGGVLIMTGANSAVGLRSMPVKFLFLDECDGYPSDLDGEGSPIDLAKRRTATFAKRKIFIVSTPTVQGESAVEGEFESTDQRYYFVPCPHCGAYQKLQWSNLVWTEGHPETVTYTCEHCQQAIHERHKTVMLSHGEWRPTNEANISIRKVGYHLNSLYSPLGWYSWVDAAREWEDAKKKPEKLKTFINTVLGETWKESGDVPEWQAIYDRREGYELNKPPSDVALITAGVDVQKDRLEVEIVGWCKNKRSYSIDYRVLMGDTAALPVWDELAKIVNESWSREDGLILPMKMMAVDTGYNTQHVYDFCRRFDVTRVIPIKGQDNQTIIVAPPKPVDVMKNGKKVGKVKVWNVAVSMIKSQLYGWLRQYRDEEGNYPHGYCHFPQYDVHYFKGLTAERLEFKLIRGFKRYQWVKEYERNEPLDCRVYARAAAAVVGIERWEDKNYDQLIAGYSRASNERSSKRRSSFWD